MKTVKIFGKTIPALAIAAILIVAVLAAGAAYTSLILGPTKVIPAEPIPQFEPVITSNYEQVVGSTAIQGITYEFNVRTANLGDADSLVKVIECVTITKDGGGIATTDITIQYNDGTGYVDFILTQGEDILTGTFPPTEGYIMTVEYDETVPFTVRFNALGEYTATLTIENAVE